MLAPNFPGTFGPLLFALLQGYSSNSDGGDPRFRRSLLP